MESCILVCPFRISGATWDALLRWKQDNTLVQAVICFGSVFPCHNFLYIYCFLDSSLMESGPEISGEKRVHHRTIWSQIPRTSLSLFLCLSHCLSSYTSLTCHLPVKTFTIEPLSFTPSPQFSSCMLFPLPPLYRSPRLDTGQVRPVTAFVSD